MKTRSKPQHDPDLGAKFLSESSVLVIGHGKSSKQSSEPEPLSKYQDPQEAHDELNAATTPSAPQSESETDDKQLGAMRIANWRHQNKQLLKKR